MMQRIKHKFGWLRWTMIALFAVVLQSNVAHTGPGTDTAVASNYDMCSLPPFLNVAVTERPNIMLLYDNSTSMALQAYNREYDPDTDYYGLFNADTCYRFDGSKFTKHPDYPEVVRETVSGGKTIAVDNKPAITPGASGADPEINATHNRRHFCSDPVYAFSGNFLNWATMRRIDLLRRAFTYGDGTGGSGQRSAPSIQGEQDFTPCYNKNYTVPTSIVRRDGVTESSNIFVVPEDHMNVRSVYARVVDAQIVFGFSCPAGTAVTSDIQELLPPILPGADVQHAATAPQGDPVPSVLELAQTPAEKDPLNTILDQLFNRFDDLAYYSSYDVGQPNKTTQLTASLDALASSMLIAGPAPKFPDLTVKNWEIRIGGSLATSAKPGDTLTISGVISNIGDADFPLGTADITLAFTGTSASPLVPPDSSCQVPYVQKGKDASFGPCNFTIPAGWLASDFPSGSSLTLTPNPSAVVSEHNPANNSGTKPFYLINPIPDLSIGSLLVTPLDGRDATATFTVSNGGPATGSFGVKFYLSFNTTLDGPEPVIPASGDCSAARSIGGSATLNYSCALDLKTACGGGLGCASGTSWTVFAVLDEAKATIPAETNYANNIGQIGITIPAAGATPAELQIVSFSAPANASIGAPFSVDFAVRNNGSLDSAAASADLYIVIAGVKTVIASCPVPAVTGSSTSTAITCSGTSPGTLSDGTSYTVGIALNYLDSNAGNNVATQSVLFKKTSFVCTTATACDYAVEVDFFGRHRTGLLWMFNKKELGRTAPANIGVTRIDHWDASGLLNSAKFGGVESNQGNNNDYVAQLEKDPPIASGKIAYTLLNLIKYYQNLAGFIPNSAPDPMLYDPVAAKDGKPHPCRKNYVLLISDGLSFDDNDTLKAYDPHTGSNIDLATTKELYDHVVTQNLGGSDQFAYAADLSDPTENFEMLDSTTYDTYFVPSLAKSGGKYAPKPIAGTNGTYHADNVALYGNLMDQRADIDGMQTVQTIVVHTFADSGTYTTNFLQGQRLMKRIAVNGSYVERDNIPGPSSKSEWDQNGDNQIDGYFPASEGTDLGEVILSAINSILLKTASGTSVSVIASTTRGEGAIYQSYFRPVTSENGVELNWLGYLQALWVDKNNELREDSIQDGFLNIVEDKIIEYDFNATSKETVAYLCKPKSDGTKPVDPDTGHCESLSREGPYPLTQLKPIFESGKVLHKTDWSNRKIYTWGHGVNEVTPSKWPVYFDKPGVSACGAGDPCLKDRLWPSTNVYAGVVTVSEMLVEWVLGKDQPWDSFRNRTAQIDGNLGVWKLGDIVYSTPTVVGAPEERYDLLYGGHQQGYTNYFTAAASRDRLVLIGANDGMLHAFYGGFFKSGGPRPTDAAEFVESNGLSLGDEVWSYVPGSVLQNLRILADSGYNTDCHVSFVDLKPKVTDVQVFFDSSGDPLPGHPGGWGTIVIGGMRLGCGKSEFSSYFILDITDPLNPFLMAEFGDQSIGTGAINKAGDVSDLKGLDFTSFYPIVMRVKDDSLSRKISSGGSSFKPGRWYMMVGSGPDTIQYNSSKAGSGIYTFDLTVLGERLSPTVPKSYKLEEFATLIDEYHNGTGWVKMPANTIIANGLTGDLDADFSVDTAYFVTHTDDDPAGLKARWKSSVWRLNTKPAGATDYKTDPHDWEVRSIFNTFGTNYQPQSAAPSLSRDAAGNIWLYFGTGRLMHKGRSDLDKIDDFNYGDGSTAYMQSLYGIIDPCWNLPSSGLMASGQPCPTLPMTPASLSNATPLVTEVEVATKAATVACVPNINPLTGSPAVTGACNTCAGGCSFQDLVAQTASGVAGTGTKFGWRRTMLAQAGTSWETSFNKPAVAGGLVLFTTYIPSIDDDGGCHISGNSYLYVLDYQTGVASPADVFGELANASGTSYKPKLVANIGEAAPSPPSIFGKQVFVQGSNAKINNIKTDAKFKLKPRIRGWQEQ